MPRTLLPYPRTPWRPRAFAVLAALLLHVAAVFFLRFPFIRSSEDVVSLVLLTDLEDTPPPLLTPGPEATGDAAAGAPETVAASDATATSGLAAAIPFLPRSTSAAEATTIPPGSTAAIRGAPLPLVVTAGGGIGRRRLDRTPEQIATARAESLLFARMEGIGVAPARDIGAVGLANGGVTVAIPWPGFLPANRSDGKWREERCSGSGDGDSDKAGESEARRAQCD